MAECNYLTGWSAVIYICARVKCFEMINNWLNPLYSQQHFWHYSTVTICHSGYCVTGYIRSLALGKRGVLGLVSRQVQLPYYMHCSATRDLIRAQSPGGLDTDQYLKWEMAFPFRVHNLIMWWESIDRAEREGCIIGVVALHIINTSQSPSSVCISSKTAIWWKMKLCCIQVEDR